MASLKFPDTGTRYVEDPKGRPNVNQLGYLYQDAALTVVAEAYTDVAGVKGALLPTDEQGRRYIRTDGYGRQVDYWGPVSGQDRLWIVINGVSSQVDADYNARIDSVETRVTVIEGDVASGVTESYVDAGDAASKDRANHTGTQSADTIVDGTTNHVFTAADDTKLGGIAAGATANSTDAQLRDRSTHSGTQSADTLTDGTTNKAFLATERTKLAGIATGATATVDATTGVKGIVQLAGDFAGTATAPVIATGAVTSAKIADGAIVDGDINASAAIAQSKVSGLVASLSGKVGKGDLVVNVEDYAVGNANYLSAGVWYADAGHTVVATDDTATIRALVTAGAKHLTFGSRRYRIQWTQQTSFLAWANTNGITIEGHGAVLCDTSTYTMNPANPYTPVFEFDACSNISVKGVDYVGPVLATPATEHGYKGSTYLRAKNGCDTVKVDATISNARYGVESGGYPTASEGYNKHFRLNLRCYFVGYPQAHYLAEDVEATIYAEDVHRATYLAGVKGLRVDIKFKNQWIANMVCLLSDSLTGLTSGTTSRGCTDGYVRVTDIGSDRTEATCVLAGIALSRIDAGTTFADLQFHVYSKSTDTVSQSVTGFQIVSGAKVLNPGIYLYNWIPEIYLQNITVSGLIDKSLQTTAHALGNLYVQTNDGTSFATVSNFRVDGYTVLPSSGEASFDYLYIQGLTDRATISNSVMNNYSLTIIGNTTAPVVIDGSTLGAVTSTTKTLWVNGSKARSLTDSSWANASAVNSDFNGASCRIRSKQIELTLTGATTSWASAIPAGVIVLGLTGVISQAITGATGVQIGVAGDPSRYLNTNTTTLGFQFTPTNQAATEQTIWWSPGGSTTIVATAKGSNFTGGKLRLFLTYIDFTAPVS